MQKNLTKLSNILLLLVLLSSNCLFSQDKKKDHSHHFHYEKSKSYDGPTNWESDIPQNLTNESTDAVPINNGGLSLDKLSGSRKEKQKKGGDLPETPKTKKAEPIQLPEIETPDFDVPDMPDVDPPVINPNVWKILLIIVVSGLLVFFVYYFLKNKSRRDKKVNQQEINLEWNPEIISKSELEELLEKAILEKNYREGIRIYFTFILKEMIRLKLIHWKTEKTNYDYLLELSQSNERKNFEESVRIFDLVWYGDYQIDENTFQQIKPVFENYYQHLSKQ